jgi:hypothetical protein
MVFSLGGLDKNMNVASPKNSLLAGAEILEKVLAPQDFHFQFHGDGKVLAELTRGVNLFGGPETRITREIQPRPGALSRRGRECIA